MFFFLLLLLNALLVSSLTTQPTRVTFAPSWRSVRACASARHLGAAVDPNHGPPGPI